MCQTLAAAAYAMPPSVVRPAANTLKSAQSSRFSLLLLEDGEYFLDVRTIFALVLAQTIDSHV